MIQVSSRNKRKVCVVGSLALTACAALWMMLGATTSVQAQGFTVLPGARPISNLPFDITECGSYFLTTCLTGVSGQDGITISADDVTINLNGFTLEGVPGSLNGIVVDGDNTNTTIVNGSVSKWGQNGINLGSQSTFVRPRRLECVNVLENQLSGIVADGGIVDSCVANDNGQNGIAVGTQAIVINCLAQGNGNDGIQMGGNCLISSNASLANAGSGIHCVSQGVDTRINDNHVTDNAVGIQVDSAPSNSVYKNSATRNTTDYSIVGGNDVGPIGPASSSTSPWANIQF